MRITLIVFLMAILVGVSGFWEEAAAEAGSQFVPVKARGAQGTVTKQAPQRSVAEGAPQSVAEGAPQSVAEGAPQSVAEGAPQSVAEGAPQSVAEGAPQGFAEGAPQGILNQNLNQGGMNQLPPQGIANE